MRIAITNFTGGEISPTLSARYDLARYRNSCQCMENFFPNLHGAATRRPGTLFLGNLGPVSDGACVLLPFRFSTEEHQNYVLIFGNKTLRVADESGLLNVTHSGTAQLATPYAHDDLMAISCAQVGDIVYLAHNKYPLHKIVRTGTWPTYTWELQPVVLNASISAPPAPSVSFGGEAGGYVLRYKVVAVDKNGKESLASPAGEAANGKHPSDWVQGNSVTITWGSVSGAEEYNVYREDAGYFGFIGISKTTTFSDQNYQADVTDTPREDWNPFTDGNNPGVVAFHQQRMILANTPKSPQAFYMSRVGDFENFRKSRPLQDDDPVEYSIASGSIDAITWAASFGDLLLGTSGSEYKASGDGQAITVKNITITAQSYWGSANLKPIIIGNSIMHVQRHSVRVRDLFYSLEKDGYAGNDLSIMAPHMFDGHTLKQWAYQQMPWSNIWVIRDDGVLLCLTYMKEHDIWGWSRHVTEGKVRSVCTVSGHGEDVLLMIVERGDSYFLERLAPEWTAADKITDAVYVDAGVSYRGVDVSTVSGLGHLEGRTVSVLADGSPVEGLQVQGGNVVLPYPASVVHVGLPYTSVLVPLAVEGDTQTGTTLGRRRALGQCVVRLHASVGGKFGPGKDELYDFPFVPTTWGDPVELYSGDVQCTPGGGQDEQATLWLVQDRALPFTVTGLAMVVDVAQN